jgi:DNA-binding Lrp family transcriptional regulator
LPIFGGPVPPEGPYSNSPHRRKENALTTSDAYVLVQTDGHTAPIARSLQDLPGIVSAEDVQGPYDAVVLARPDSLVDSLEEIVEEIRALPGVLHALAAPLAGVDARVLTAA